MIDVCDNDIPSFCENCDEDCETCGRNEEDCIEAAREEFMEGMRDAYD